MSNVVNFPGRGKSVIVGAAKCLACGHEWAAEAPVGTIELVCPECDVQRGVFMALVAPPNPRSCPACGNQLYFIGDTKTLCAMCGTTCWR